MKRFLYTFVLLCMVGIAITVAYTHGHRVGSQESRIDALAGMAAATVYELEYLRDSDYADTNHLNASEATLDWYLSNLAALTTYDDMDPQQQTAIAIVKGYRTRHPYAVPVAVQMIGAAFAPQFRETIHQQTEAFLAKVPSIDPLPYKDQQRLKESNKGKQATPQ